MSDSTLQTWQPTQRQRNVARLLAIGYSQAAAADYHDVPRRTVQNWCALEPFEELVAAYHRTAWQRVEPGIMANVELAIEVQRAMLKGEVKPDDKRYIEARNLIDRILNRLLYVEPADGTDRVAAPASVNVNVLAAGGNG